MPRGDGTGPMGMGPMTGRAAGYCAGFSNPGFANPAPRMGMGFRRGAGFYGRGFARGFGRGIGRGLARRTIKYAPATFQQPVQPQQTLQQPAYPVAPQTQTPAQPSRVQGIQMLENQLTVVESQISQIRERIKQIKSQGV